MTLSTVSSRPRPIEVAVAHDAVGSWRAWRAARAAELRRPHGWLSLTGFAWLTPDEQAVPGLPGRWSADGQAVTLTADRVDGLDPVAVDPPPTGVHPVADPFVVPAGAALHGTVRIPVADGASVIAVRHGDRRIELLRRAGRPALRIRDPHARTRTAFRGIPTYDWDERWVVPAHFVPAPEPVAEVVLTARPDLLTTAVTHGRVDFVVHGRRQSLAAAQAADGTLTLAFRDPTNGGATASWRVVATAAPDVTRGVLLDFNRAINPPFAFTPYGTCPAPVAANRLSVPVTAGEQAPAVVGDLR